MVTLTPLLQIINIFKKNKNKNVILGSIKYSDLFLLYHVPDRNSLTLLKCSFTRWFSLRSTFSSLLPYISWVFFLMNNLCLNHHRNHKTTNLSSLLTVHFAAFQGSFPNGFFMDGGVPQGHGETLGCHRGGAHGRAVVLFSEVRVGRRDGLLDSQSISSALCYWVCSAVHFQPEQ